MNDQRFERAYLNISHYLGLRHIGGYEHVGNTWTRLFEIAFRLEIGGANMVAFGISYDDPAGTPAGQLRYDACLSMSGEQLERARQTLATADLVGGTFAGLRIERLGVQQTVMTLHRGDYRHLREAYAAAIREIGAGAAGLTRPRPPFIEVYRHNPLLTPKEGLVTELHFPCAPLCSSPEPWT